MPANPEFMLATLAAPFDRLAISPIDEFVYLGEVSYIWERLCPDGTMQPYKSSSEQSDCIGHNNVSSTRQND